MTSQNANKPGERLLCQILSKMAVAGLCLGLMACQSKTNQTTVYQQAPTGKPGNDSGQTVSLGPSDGGGAKGIVCRDSGAVKSVELLDLWEAKTIYRRNPMANNSSVKDLVEAGLKRLENVFSKNIAGNWQPSSMLALETIRFLDKTERVQWLRNVNLSLTVDSFEDASPREAGCQIEQLVIYKDKASSILVNADLVDKMDSINKAALYLHEALYRILREEHLEKTSLRARRVIGFIMAGGSFEPFESVIKGPRVVCKHGDWDNDFAHRTLINFVRKDDGFAMVSEIFDGLPALGVGLGMTISPISEPAKLLKQSLGWFPKVNLSSSIADFDTLIHFSTAPISQAKFQLYWSPNNSEPRREFNLDCKVVEN